MEHRPGRRRGRRGALGDRPDHPEHAAGSPPRSSTSTATCEPGCDLKVPGADGVFAIGDVAATDPLRSSARNFTFKLLARNVRAHLDGRPLKTFDAAQAALGVGQRLPGRRPRRLHRPGPAVPDPAPAGRPDGPSACRRSGLLPGDPPLIWIDAPRCSESSRSSCSPLLLGASALSPASVAVEPPARRAADRQDEVLGVPGRQLLARGRQRPAACTPRSAAWLSHMSTDRRPAPRLRAVVRRRAQLRHPDHRRRQAPQEGAGAGSTTAPRATRSATRSATTPGSRAAAARTATSTRSSSTSRSASSTRSSTPGSRTGSGRAARAPSGR